MSHPVYITTPIFYVNGAPHIGHAYTAIAADVLARWHRAMGRDVFLLTGTDEHGQKVAREAEAHGVAPQAFADDISAKFRAMEDAMGVAYDDFIRTTEPRHKTACAALWERLSAAGDIYLGGYEGFYAIRDEAFYDEGELVTLPDGTKLAPSGAPAEWVREPSYFFRLSAYQDRLLAHYADNPGFLAPFSASREIESFVRGGLSDLSISRTNFSWGVPVPGDPAHVMYVWLDALTNYLSGVGWPEASPREKFWPPAVHLVGKDILRFHAVYWPAFLMSAGLPLPAKVFAHGWFTIEGQKMSKSIGNVVDPVALADRVGVDALRFHLLRELTFGSDGNFSEAALHRRYASELANDLGNLAQRVLTFVAKNVGGRPAAGPITEADRALLDAAHALPASVDAALSDRLAIHDALEDVWRVVRASNAYVDHQAPWGLRKTDPARMATVLRVVLDVLRVLGTVLAPVMPGTMGRLLDQLGVFPHKRQIAHLGHALPDGEPLPPPAVLFPRHADPASPSP